jgi:hypothetical protein
LALARQLAALRIEDMQYALVDRGDGKRVIVDAVEYVCLSHYAMNEDAIKDEAVDDSLFVWKVVYGAIVGQPNIPCEKLLEYFMGFKGCGFGRIVDGVCCISEVRDFVTLEPRTIGIHQYFFIPVAVLLGTTEQIPPISKGRALTLFPRFTPKMKPLTNVLNRPGILCIRGEERHAKPDPDADEWKNHIKPDRAIKAALACR